jgi:hypothetical protein
VSSVYDRVSYPLCINSSSIYTQNILYPCLLHYLGILGISADKSWPPRFDSFDLPGIDIFLMWFQMSTFFLSY